MILSALSKRYSTNTSHTSLVHLRIRRRETRTSTGGNYKRGFNHISNVSRRRLYKCRRSIGIK